MWHVLCACKCPVTHNSTQAIHLYITKVLTPRTCTHVHMYVHTTHTCTLTYVRTFKTALYISMYVCMYTQTHTHTHAHQLPLGDSQILLHFHVLPSGPSQRNPNPWKRATLTHTTHTHVHSAHTHMYTVHTHTHTHTHMYTVHTHTHVHSAHTTWTGWLCTLTTHRQGENELSSAPSTVHTPLCVHSFQTHLTNDIPNCVLVDGQVVLR